MRRIPFSSLLITVLIVFSAISAHAYNFSWSTHEDITKNNPDNPPGECGNCSCEGPPDCRTGSPVYLKTGHLSWDESDINLPGRLPLQLNRSYSSHDARMGLFGNGWISNLERALVKTTKTKSTEDGKGTYQETYFIFRHPNGLRYTFRELEDGSLETPKGLFQHIEKLADGSYTFSYPDGTVETYSDGNMVSRMDKNGNGLDLVYDESSLLQHVQNDAGSSLFIYYGANGFVSSVQDHTGRNWSYNYDDQGNLISVVNPLGASRTFSYQSYKPVGDAQVYSQLTKITDESGVDILTVTYTGERVASYTEGANRFSYTFDFNNRSATKRDSVGSQYGYNWDVNGLLTRLIDPLGGATTIERNAELVKTGEVDEAGFRWNRTVDDKGRVLTTTSPLGRTITYEYSGDNPHPVKITSALGHVTSLGYDSSYNITSITNALGETTKLTVDTWGNITGITDAMDHTTKITYNDLSLPIAVTDPLGRTTSYSYDELGRTTGVTDAENRTSRFEYDGLSRLVHSVNALNHAVAYNYDAAGRLLDITDPVGNRTVYSYDQYGRLLAETRPDGGQTNYIYNADNTAKTIVRPDGTTISYGYDAAKRVIQENVGGDIAQYAYDKRGYLTGAENNMASLGFSYDAAGRLLAENQNGLPVEFSYDMDDRRTGLTYADESLSYVRNAAGFADTITSSLTSDTFTFQYDATGALLATLLPNALSNRLSYNAAHELTAVTAGSSFIDYSRDATGLILSKVTNGAGKSYSYDAGQRLVSADGTSYVYDIAGNNRNNNATFAPDTNRLLEDDSTAYSYSPAGNLVQKQNKIDGSRSDYTWNSRNQLLKVERYDSRNQLVRQQTFTYDPLGRRLSKTSNNQTVNYLYDSQDIVAILNENGEILSTIVHAEYIDSPLSITTGDQTYYYHQDHQGSILSLTDALQNEVESYNYDPYGVTSLNQTVTTNNPYAFTGRELDDIDLYYYRARYYDPTIQRFLGEDPIGFGSGDFNFYRYVANDPVNFIDPWGLEEEHTKGKRPSAKGKHEEGQARKKTDQGGEKGDKNRRYPRNPPGGWKNWKKNGGGPWPPGTYPLFLLPGQIECIENPLKCSPNYCPGEDQA